MRRSIVAAAACVALTAAACSLPGGQKTEPSAQPPGTSAPGSSTPASQAPSAGTSSVVPSGAPSDTAQPSGTPDTQDLGPVVATRTSSSKGETMRLEVHPIVRDGNLSHITLTVSSAKEMYINYIFTDFDSSAGDSSFGSADGIRLVDTAGNKVYLVASDGHGNCLCSRDLANVRLQDDEPYVITASFATPPANVTSLEVDIPHFGVFPRVPVN